MCIHFSDLYKFLFLPLLTYDYGLVLLGYTQSYHGQYVSDAGTL